MTTETKPGPRLELSPEFTRAYIDTLHALGVRDQGGGVYNVSDIQAAVEQVGGPEGFLKHMAYHAIRHARGLDILESLTAEIRQLAHIAAMPTKLVRDKTGRSVGAEKIPSLGKLH